MSYKVLFLFLKRVNVVIALSNSVLVVGCDVTGNIMKTPTSSMSLTHAEAINKNQNCFYGYSIQIRKKKVFAKKWNMPRSFNDLNEINENADIDIIVIASHQNYILITCNSLLSFPQK